MDFKNGNDCRVCKDCYNQERQWSKHDVNEANKTKKAAKALAQQLNRLTGENGRLEGEVEQLEEEVERLRDGNSELERRVRDLESHVSNTAVLAQIHKRKIRSDSSTTPWKERLVVASPAGSSTTKPRTPLARLT